MKPEDALLKVIADNPALTDALKVKFLGKFSLRKIEHKGIDDAVIGQMTRARLVGREMVEEAFAEIARLKTISSQPHQNPAR